MNSNQNSPAEPLSIWADTPFEGRMYNDFLQEFPGNQWENAPLTNAQQADLVSGHFAELAQVVCRGETGSFGSISIGFDMEAKQRRAVKLIKCKYSHPKFVDLVHTRRVQRKVDLLERVSGHDHIVQYYSTAFDSATGHAMIKTECLEQSLDVVVEKHALADGVIVRIAEQLVDALCYLHDHKIVHHDLKPDNIMLAKHVHLFLSRGQINQQLMDSTIKIIDLGMAKLYSSANPIEFDYRKGARRFLSPEKLNTNLPYDANQSDQYALGVVLLYAYTSKRQLTKHRKDNPKLVLAGSQNVPNWPQVAHELIPLKSRHCVEHIILGLLKSENDRYTAPFVKSELARLPEQVKKSMESSFDPILD